jgi:hypothetical protein
MAAWETPSSNSSTETYATSMPYLSPLTYGGEIAQSPVPTFPWNLTAACRPLLTTFNYLSTKLSQQGIHLAFVVTNSRPEIIPAWPIDLHTQHFLAKLIQRADVKYSIEFCWMRALKELCKPVEPSESFEKHRAITYLIHRSLLQRDIIFSGDGLTVVAVDCIYTFKTLISELASETTIPLFRDDCKESCVELLKHVNSIYKDVVLSKSYLRRAYTHINLRDDILEEVCEAYHAKYGADGAIDVPSSPVVCRERRESELVSIGMIDRSQESPKKFPDTPKENRRQSAAFAARAALPGPESVHKASLASAFQYDPKLSKPVEPNLERPKSPKTSLFESPRSPPETPPRSARLRTMSKSADLRAATATNQRPRTASNATSTEPPPPPPPPSKNAETASIISLKKRRLLAPFFGLSRSTSVSARNKTEDLSKDKSFEFRRPSDPGARSRDIDRGPPSISRSSSLNRHVKPLISRYGFSSSLAKLSASQSNTQLPGSVEMERESATMPRASDLKFGWLQVMKKKNGFAMPATQRVF